MLINIDECIVSSNNNAAWIAADGIVKRKITEEKAFDIAEKKVKEYFDGEMADKEKLFNIRRTIAWTFKEGFRGEKYEWPFRFEGVLCKSHDSWAFRYMQFSYPFSYILEGKDDITMQAK